MGNGEEAVPETAAGSREEQLQWYDEKLEESQVSEDFLDSLDQFSYRTASALLAEPGEGENENYSPLSLYYALGMAAMGADWGNPDGDGGASRSGKSGGAGGGVPDAL